MQSPNGINYPPRRPQAKRLRPAIAVGVIALGAVILALIYWGIQERATASAAAPPSHVGPATATAQELVSHRRPTPAVVQAPPPQAAPVAYQAAAPPPAPMRAAAPPPAQVAQPTAPPQPTAAEKRLADALAAEQKALEAPASPSGWKVAGTTANAQAQPQAPARPIVADDQDDKTDFLKSGQRATRKTVLSASRVAPIGKYVIATGWRIPAALEPMMDSDLPGEVTALVRENVYDTATGRYLLIPQGARLFGAYSSHVSYAQRGAQAVWYRITFPDASSLNLEGMQGHDAQGRAGFRDKVDNHYARLIGTAILTSAFMAGSALAQSRRGSTLAYPSAAETASSAASANMSEQMLEITRRNLNVQPTLQIRSGYPFDVMVNRDMAFDGPYAALPMR